MTNRPYEIVDFAQLQPVPCPCGEARRAFADTLDFPGTIHVTDIHEDAHLHFHRRLTETYFFLECEPGAAMQLDDDVVPVKPGMCILIRPGTCHRAIGRMRVLIVVYPKFDPADEWLVDPNVEVPSRCEPDQLSARSAPPVADPIANPSPSGRTGASLDLPTHL